MKVLNLKCAVLTIVFIFLLFTLKAQIITTVAGNGTEGFSGNGKLATEARIGAYKMVVDTIHNYLYFSGFNWVRKIDLNTDTLTTIAGNGQSVYGGDNDPATKASFIQSSPSLAIDSVGNVLVLDDGRLRKIDFKTGIITTIAGDGTLNNSGDGGLAVNAEINGTEILIDKEGTIFLLVGQIIREIDPHTGIISLLTNSSLAGYDAYIMSLGPNNQLFFWNVATAMVFGSVVDTKTKVKSGLSFSTSSGSFSSDNCGRVYGINDLINNFVTNPTNATIIRYDSIENKNILVVGNSTKGFSGDSGLAVNAAINTPFAPVFDKFGNLYFYDQGNARIRKVTTPYIDSTPYIQSLSPIQACPGDTIYLSGEYFTGTDTVNIGGVNAASFKITSDRTIWVVVPLSNTGSVTAMNNIGSDISTQNVLINNPYDSVDLIYTSSNSAYNGLSIINSNFKQVTSTINLGFVPDLLAMTNDGKKLYFLNTNDNTLNVLNTTTNNVESSLKLGFQPTYLSLSKNGLFSYIKDNINGSKIYIVNNSTNSFDGSVTIPEGVNTCISTDGSLLYISSSSSIYIIDSVYKIVTAKLNVPNNGFVIDNNGENLYVCCSDSNAVYKINTNTFQIDTTLYFAQLNSLSINLDATELYVFNKKAHLNVINLASSKLEKAFSVGNGGYVDYISFSPNNKSAYVLNLNTIYKIDLTSNKIVSSFTSSGGQLFVSNQVVSCHSALPIKIEDISAKSEGKINLIIWQTATELNTDHFIIQQSTDGSSYKDIGTVKTIGSGANSYSFADNNPANGINFYRLESVDKDGASTFSAVVSCKWLVVSKQITVYPNPAKDNVTISGSHIASVQVIDNMGRVVKGVLLKDATNPKLSVSSLQAGVYHLRIQTIDGNVSGVALVVN